MSDQPVVYWEDDPTRTRFVHGVCVGCQAMMRRDYGITISIKNVAIVSPTGLAHAQHSEHPERTACGRDATGPDWWWRT